MNTFKLTGEALDFAVAQCEGHDVEDPTWWADFGDDCCYSTDWAQGGPIIAREGITLRCGLNGWDAELPEFNLLTHGESALIAAMRCYAASKQEATL